MALKASRRMMDRASGPVTVIGDGIRIEGQISGTGQFVIGGTVVGDCDLEGPVTLAEGGCWEGRLKGADIIIAGRLEGDVEAAGQLEITRSAHISGSVTGGSIAIAEGAVIEGEIHMRGEVAPTRFEDQRQSD